MPNVRAGKERAYPGIQVGSLPGNAGAYRFDALVPVAMFYATNATIVASSANTTIYDVYVCPQQLVIVKLAIVYNTGAAYAAGADKWNIVMDAGNEAHAGAGTAEGGASAAAQTLAVAGNSVFAADKAFAGATVSKDQVVDQVIPDVPEAFYPAGAILSLRVVTSAAVGTHFQVSNGYTMQVFALVAPMDPKPFVNTANPATDF